MVSARACAARRARRAPRRPAEPLRRRPPRRGGQAEPRRWPPGGRAARPLRRHGRCVRSQPPRRRRPSPASARLRRRTRGARRSSRTAPLCLEQRHDHGRPGDSGEPEPSTIGLAAAGSSRSAQRRQRHAGLQPVEPPSRARTAASQSVSREDDDDSVRPSEGSDAAESLGFRCTTCATRSSAELGPAAGRTCPPSVPPIPQRHAAGAIAAASTTIFALVACVRDRVQQVLPTSSTADQQGDVAGAHNDDHRLVLDQRRAHRHRAR